MYSLLFNRSRNSGSGDRDPRRFKTMLPTVSERLRPNKSITSALITKPTIELITRTTPQRRLSLRHRFPIPFHVIFWIIFVLLHYIFVAILAYIIERPAKFYEKSTILFVVAVDIISLYFLIFRRRETFSILNDARFYLGEVSFYRLNRLDRHFKYYLGAYLLYTVVVLILQLSSESSVLDKVKWYNSDFSEYLSFGRNVKNVYVIFAETILKTLSLFVCGGFLVLLWSYLFSLVAELGRTLIDYAQETRFSQIDAFNDRFLAVVSLIQRLNRLLKYLLVLWFAVTLYSSCYSVAYYIMAFNVVDELALYFKLPYAFQEVIQLAFLTVAASKMPDAMEDVAKRLLFLSKEALLVDKSREYQFLKEQFSGGDDGLGIKLGGMFLITRKLFLSFLGVGVTYVVITIQLNPFIFKKLQGDLAKSMDNNETEREIH